MSQTLIVDVAVQQLLPCMGLSTVGTHERWRNSPNGSKEVCALHRISSGRAEISGIAVKAVMEYTAAGGVSNPNATRPCPEIIHDYRAYVRHMMI
jgi:hypothetical protein